MENIDQTLNAYYRMIFSSSFNSNIWIDVPIENERNQFTMPSNEIRINSINVPSFNCGFSNPVTDTRAVAEVTNSGDEMGEHSKIVKGETNYGSAV